MGGRGGGGEVGGGEGEHTVQWIEVLRVSKCLHTGGYPPSCVSYWLCIGSYIFMSVACK